MDISFVVPEVQFTTLDTMQQMHFLRFFGQSQGAITLLPLWNCSLRRLVLFYLRNLIIASLFPLSATFQSALQPPVCQDWRRPASVRQACLARPRHHQVVGRERLGRSTTMLQPRLVHVWQHPGNQPVVRVLRLVLVVVPFHHEVADLEMPVQKVVHVKVFIVVAERIDQDLGHVEPAKVEEKLEKGEEGDAGEERKVEGMHILDVANVIFSVRSVCRDSDPAKWVFLSHILALFQIIRRRQALRV